MKTSSLLAVLASLPMFGCLVRAPTTHELDRRAGLLVIDDTNGTNVTNAPPPQVRTSSAVARSPLAPVRLPPLVEKVWVSDLPLGPDARLQGTWLYLEVDRGRWLDEVDPGGAPLLDLERPPARSVAAPSSPGTGDHLP